MKELSNHGLVCMTFLHKLVYLYYAHEVMQVIQMHGLFPQPSELLQSMSPDLHSIYNVKIRGSRDPGLKADVMAIFEAMGRNKFIRIQNHITRTICRSANQHDVETSLLPYYLVMMACNFAEKHLHYQNPRNGIPMFIKGSVIGPTNTTTDRNHDLNNLILRTEHEDDDDWDEYKVKRLADLETTDRDMHGDILSIRIAAKGCFRPINDTLTNTEEHSKHVEFLNPFTLPVDDEDYKVLLEMNRELKDPPKKRQKGKKSKKGDEDDDDEVDGIEDVESPSANTPNTARTGDSDAGTGGLEEVSGSGGSASRRSKRTRSAPERMSGMLYRKSYDEGGSEEEDDDDEFSRASPPKAKRLRYNNSALSPPQNLLRAAQAKAMAEFMKVLQKDPAHKALTKPAIKFWESTFGSFTPKKKTAMTSFADIEQAAIDLTKDDDEFGEDPEETAVAKQCTRDEIIKKFSQINFQHKNPTDLSSQPDIDTINTTLGISAPGMVKPHHIRYKDQFVFIVMSRELCRSVWSKWKEQDGKPLNNTAEIVFNTLLHYSSRGWKVSLFINTTEPGELVVLVTDKTYDHLKNNKLARVYKTDSGSSGSDEGSDDAESGKDDGDESKQNESGNEKGESNESGDETRDDGEKEDTSEGEAVEEMDIDIDDGVASESGDGGEESATGHKRDGGSQATQAEPTSQNIQEPVLETGASNVNETEDPTTQDQGIGTAQQGQPEDKQDELEAADMATSQDANKNKDANDPSEPTGGDNHARIDDDQNQSHAGGPKESVDAPTDHQAPPQEGDDALNKRTTRSKSPHGKSNAQIEPPTEEENPPVLASPKGSRKKKKDQSPSPGSRKSARQAKKMGS